MQNIIKIFLGMVLAAMPALAAQAQEIPVETLFKKAEFGSIQLSPNGKLLGAVVQSKGASTWRSWTWTSARLPV